MNYSSFPRRFLGTFIDTLIIASISFAINRTIPVIGWIISLSLGFFYYPFFWSSTARATPGKYLMGTTITDMLGNRISLRTAFIRYFCSWLSCLILGFGYFLCLFTEKKQTLHDILAGTIALDEKINFEESLFDSWLNQIKTLRK